MMEVQEQNAQQHQHGAQQGIEKKLDCGVEPARTAPDADQQVHGYQHGFPENEEQEEIQGHEDAEHSGLQYQEPRVVFLHSGVDGSPGREDRNQAEQCRQQDQQERNAVDP